MNKIILLSLIYKKDIIYLIILHKLYNIVKYTNNNYENNSKIGKQS